MLYFKLQQSEVVEVRDSYPGRDVQWADMDSPQRNGWIARSDLRNALDAEAVAVQASKLTGKKFMTCDSGEGVYPRFDIIESPKIGDRVSRAFNGDAYPCGTIIAITPGLRITTDQGHKFNRQQKSGAWKEIGSPFYMIHGDHYEQNPHF